jgi:Tol biopolymer transport system component
MSRFLRFVVAETLVNGADAVKEVTVALAVFDRPADFNPKLDPVVRNEARRLRGKLDAYYAGEGSSDCILISIPKGHYAPAFTAQNRPFEEAGAAVKAPPPPAVEPVLPVPPPRPSAAGHVIPEPVPSNVASPARKPALWFLLAVGVAALAASGFGFLSRKVPAVSASITIAPLTSEVAQDFDPAVSPDGQSIAFAREGPEGKPNIYIQPLNGVARRLTTSSENDLHPAWSPDGQTIAFLRAGPETSRVIVVPASGGTEKQIVVPGRFDPGHQRAGAGPLDRLTSPGPAWSPDGKSLVFRQCLPLRENGCPLHLVSLETLQVRRLTEQIPGASDMSPAWSPDGRRLAFARFVSSGSADLYMVSASGGPSTRLTDEGQNIRGLAWTGDGRSLVISSNRNGGYGLWAVSVEDRTFRQINAAGETAIEPAVSRDDRLLIYADANTNINIWRYDVERRASEKLIVSTRHNSNAVWSPDGRRIAFTSDRMGSWELWVANVDGSHPVELTKFGRGEFGRLQWSPDGRQLAFEVRDEGGSQVFVIPPEGGSPKRLLKESSEQRVPFWSKDGRWIYFASNRAGKTQVWKTPAGGGGVELVCDCAAEDGFESPDGRSLLFSSTSQKGIWEVPFSSGSAHLVAGLENVNPRRWWTVGADGIWFYDESPEQPGVFFYSFATQKVDLISNLDRMLAVSTPSLSISPDGKYLIFSRFDSSHSKLMAIRGPFLDR